MKYCSHCGKELMSGAVFCTHCGQPVSPSSDPAEATINDAANDAADKAEAAERPGPMFERGPKAPPRADWVSDGWEEAPAQPKRPAGGGNTAPPGNFGSGNPYDHTADYGPQEISDNKVICMMIYLFPLAGLIIALLADRASDARTSYIGFHIRQEIKLDVFSILVSLVTLVVTWLITLISGGLAISSASSYSSYGYYGASSGMLGGMGGMLAGLGLQLLILGIVALVLFIVRFICFVQVCKSRAVEAPIVRGIGFLR
ncbi:zinc ribbon domain-containing protein [Pseudoramibacter faecis]|uniref:zinc ribbon domain-containing protein n=1 Tax=Pseudoramibacter faecis TaxID=3108534 RepID=UPI002E77C2D4|nr:zinc ribbon domain-containing protein [Pseudoramibacter sp. HA2172]